MINLETSHSRIQIRVTINVSKRFHVPEVMNFQVRYWKHVLNVYIR